MGLAFLQHLRYSGMKVSSQEPEKMCQGGRADVKCSETRRRFGKKFAAIITESMYFRGSRRFQSSRHGAMATESTLARRYIS